MEASSTASQTVPVHVVHAGSLSGVIGREIGPDFTERTGIEVKATGGASVALANRIRSGQLRPDLFVSADAEVIADLLIGPGNGHAARWCVVVCRQRIVLAYSPAGRFTSAFEDARRGSRPWYEVLQAPGLRLKRSDPSVDPGGYRAVFALALAESHYGVPGLRDAVLGGDDNPAQIAAGDYAALARGEIDAALTYVTNAVSAGVPYLDLPPEVDQSDPRLAASYATASYTSPSGQNFRGTPMTYGATIPEAAPNSRGGASFLAYLLSDAGRAAFGRYGFLPAQAQTTGDTSSIPAPLRALLN